jgi:tRNA(Arg) A34 adenosine deaminase TadA
VAYNPKWAQQVMVMAEQAASEKNGGPFAALVVQENTVIAQACNRVLVDHDPTAHAEILAIRQAASALATHDLSGCELYCSCEPCPMCLSAIFWARIDQVWYCAGRDDAAAAGFDDALFYQRLQQPESGLVSPCADPHIISQAAALLREWGQRRDRILY